MKEQWIIAYEELEAELGREPTAKEVDRRCEENLATQYDEAKNLTKHYA